MILKTARPRSRRAASGFHAPDTCAEGTGTAAPRVRSSSPGTHGPSASAPTLVLRRRCWEDRSSAHTARSACVAFPSGPAWLHILFPLPEFGKPKLPRPGMRFHGALCIVTRRFRQSPPVAVLGEPTSPRGGPRGGGGPGRPPPGRPSGPVGTAVGTWPEGLTGLVLDISL